MVVLHYFGKVLVAFGLIVGLMGGVAWSETEKSEESKPAQKNILKDAFSKLAGKKVEGQASQKSANNELKAKLGEEKKPAQPAPQTSAKASAKPPAKTPVKVEKKEKSKGVLSKIAETVTDTVRDTIKVLTPESKDAKQPAKKAADKTVKKEPKKPVKTSKVVKKTKPPAKTSVPVEKKEKPKGVLDKITESVADAVRDTLEVLTPGSTDAKKSEDKVVAKIEKKKTKPRKSDNEMLAKEGEEQVGEKKSNRLIDSFKKLAGGSDKAEAGQGSQ